MRKNKPRTFFLVAAFFVLGCSNKNTATPPTKENANLRGDDQWQEKFAAFDKAILEDPPIAKVEPANRERICRLETQGELLRKVGVKRGNAPQSIMG